MIGVLQGFLNNVDSRITEIDVLCLEKGKKSYFIDAWLLHKFPPEVLLPMRVQRAILVTDAR